MKPIVDIVKEVVETLNTDGTLAKLQSFPINGTNSRNLTAIKYYHGHPIEVVNTLQQLALAADTRLTRFPAICLFQDFAESLTPQGYNEARLNIVLCATTDAKFDAAKRYENNFKPILYPLLDAFIAALEKHKNVVTYGFQGFTKIDRLFWGKSGLYGNTANIFNDFIDAIELENFLLKTVNNNC